MSLLVGAISSVIDDNRRELMSESISPSLVKTATSIGGASIGAAAGYTISSIYNGNVVGATLGMLITGGKIGFHVGSAIVSSKSKVSDNTEAVMRELIKVTNQRDEIITNLKVVQNSSRLRKKLKTTTRNQRILADKLMKLAKVELKTDGLTSLQYDEIVKVVRNVKSGKFSYI